MIHIKLPQPPDTRRPTGPNDWGDILTIGLHLKSRDPKSKYQWGIYLGLNKVGIKDLSGFDIKGILNYDSNEKMHKEWILD